MLSYENTNQMNQMNQISQNHSSEKTYVSGYLVSKPFNTFIINYLKKRVRQKYPDAELHGQTLGYYWIDAGAGMNFKALSGNCRTELTAWLQAWRNISHDIF